MAAPRKSDLKKNFRQNNRHVNAPVDKEGHTSLHTCVRKGDAVGVVKLLARRNANPDQPDIHGQTALFEAITARNLNLVAILLQYGADTGYTDKQGRTPLMWAIEQNCDVTFLKKLESFGKFTEATNGTGRTVLHAAAAADRTDLIDYFLKAGVPLDLPDDAGKTALHLATEVKSYNALKRLLDSGSNPVLRTKNIETPLYLAAAAGDTRAVDILLAQPAVRTSLNEFKTYNDGYTPLMAAAHAGHKDAVQKLVDAGADVNQRDNMRRNSLYIAAAAGFPDVAELLILEGADLRDSSPQASSPLILSLNEEPAVYEQLLQLVYAAGADINAKDAYGQTALHHAASFLNKNSTERLLEMKADTNQADNLGRRPLDIAIDSLSYGGAGATDLIDILLKNGADPNITADAKRYFSPLHMAARSGQTAVVKKLVEHGANVEELERSPRGETALLMAAEYGHLDTTMFLIKQGADPLKKDAYQKSVLHVAAACGAKALLENLVKIPALKQQINDADGLGMAPIHYASRSGSIDGAIALLEQGADVEAPDAGGYTPLHYAVSSNNPTLLSILKGYAAKSDFINTKTKQGDTPLHIAVRNWSIPVAENLLKMGADTSLTNQLGQTPLALALMSGNIQMATLFIDSMKKRQIPMDQEQDTNKWTSLHHAAARGTPDLVSQLLDNGSDINAKNADGETALHIAARNGQIGILAFLVKKGIDLRAKNAAGYTALEASMLAAPDEKIVALLKEAEDGVKQRPAATKAKTTSKRRPPFRGR